MRDLTKGNIYKTFILFAIPMVLSGVLSQCYSVVNTIIAGKLLGENSLAVIGSVSPLETLINSLFWGYGMGVGIFACQLFGAKKYYRMKSVIVNNFIFLSVVAVLISVLVIVFKSTVYSFLSVDKAIVEECNRYFVISMLGKVFVLFSVNCVYVVNAMGDSTFPFIMSLLSTVLNIVIGVLSVTRLHMGAEGLAFGNVLSAIIVGTVYILKLSDLFKKLRVNKHKSPFNFKVIKQTCGYSVFTMIQQSIMYFAGFILSPMLNAIGSSASASYTVSLRIYDINATVYQNSAKTVGNYTAQSYGAKKYGLLKRGLRVGFIQSMLFILPLLLISCIFAENVVMLFFGADVSQLSVDYSVAFVRYCMPILLFNVVANLFHNFFRGIGYMKALVIATLSGTLSRIIISYFLIKPFGVYGYYIGWAASWIFDSAAGLILYLFGKWRIIYKRK